MPKNESTKSTSYRHIRDARGRPVTQINLVAAQVLGARGMIEPEVLERIVSGPGVRVSRVERGALYLSVMLAFGVVVSFLARAMGTEWAASVTKPLPTVGYLLIWPFIVWGALRKKRFGKMAGAMLSHLRCPHCGYELRGLPASSEDGATVCPECGCAWLLDTGSNGGADEEAESAD